MGNLRAVLLPTLFTLAPETIEKYRNTPNTSEAAKDTAEWVTLPDVEVPGVYSVCETILVPLLIRWSRDPEKSDDLIKVMDWIEALASSEDINVRSLVSGGICEPLITNRSDSLPYLAPYIGPKTKRLARLLYTQFRVSDATRALLVETPHLSPRGQQRQAHYGSRKQGNK